MPDETIRPSASASSAIIDWLLTDARRLPSGPALLKELGQRLYAKGLPLMRASFHVRTLHPQLYGIGFFWYRGQDDIRIFEARHGLRDTDLYQRSPLRLIFDEGVDQIHESLERDDDSLEFPLYAELKAEGMTDYLSLPLTFSDGKTHATTWTTDRRGGFAADDIEQVKTILPIFSLLIEIHLNRRIAINLLNTYVGHHAGERILDGQITRGNGESVEAAIWFCDLRGFTKTSESKSRDQLLSLLNQYFDRMAEPVTSEGGEILKFIGDAMLAIFPLDDEVGDDACKRALNAAIQAQESMAELNMERATLGQDRLACGIALHVGEVMYGNIGSANRLDFTVIGPAVNLTSRIEGMCRRLGSNILLSDDFSERCGSANPRRSLGLHQLAGIRRKVELFTPDIDDKPSL
ncbi:MAG: adenylate/guanylate cyclase domain-containing protein [Geminicoccaceae bacterium]